MPESPLKSILSVILTAYLPGLVIAIGEGQLVSANHGDARDAEEPESQWSDNDHYTK